MHFSSPQPASHTSEFVHCVCKAHGQKTQGRSGPVPNTCSKGTALSLLCFSILVLCFPLEDVPASVAASPLVNKPLLTLWGMHYLSFPWGVAPFLLHLQPPPPRTTTPGRCWGFSPFHTLYPVLRSGAGREEAAAEHGCVSPAPGPGLNASQHHLQCFTEDQTSLLWMLKVVSLLPCLCSERTCLLKHLHSKQTQQAQG